MPIAPGPVDTPRFQGMQGKHVDQMARFSSDSRDEQPVPLEAAAQSCLFLASETGSGHITGQLVNDDSGKCEKFIGPLSSRPTQTFHPVPHRLVEDTLAREK